ncbi:MAG: PEP/pyruvate-binding domain-containing protein, partial [Actinobacteria bacterium]|nr:PEP/pyruvate-binding domain-containing protein [Actinomycetota bacterium]
MRKMQYIANNKKLHNSFLCSENDRFQSAMIVVELKNNLSVRELGGKGYSLGVLIKNNFDVPKGFVIISEAFFKFLKYNGLTEKIEKLASKIDKENYKEESLKIKDLILEGKIPEDIVLEIKESLNNLNAQHVSIRSSAVSEDSLKASFAGMHDTFLNIKSEPNIVLNYIKKCWASLFNERAVAYRIRMGFTHLEGMAVVIQEMIPAEISGTTFTAHPDTRDMSIMVI